MKYLRSYVTSLVAIAAALAMVSSVEAQNATVGRAKVVRMKGQARFTTGNGVWQPLKVGDVVKPGTIIQTAMERGSFVDLVLGEGPAGVLSDVGSVGGSSSSSSPATPMSGYQAKGQQNMVRIWENTALGIDKLSSMKTGADEVTETQLDLKSGRLTGSVKKMSAASKYEIKLPNGVAGIRGTLYDITADGVVRVVDGSVVIAYMAADGSVTTKVVTGGNKFDARTGDITAMTAAEIASIGGIFANITPHVQVTAPTRVPISMDKTPTPQTQTNP